MPITPCTHSLIIELQWSFLTVYPLKVTLKVFFLIVARTGPASEFHPTCSPILKLCAIGLNSYYPQGEHGLELRTFSHLGDAALQAESKRGVGFPSIEVFIGLWAYDFSKADKVAQRGD
jgi:hypothetical protein